MSAGEVERLKDQLASLRVHTLDSNPALRALHEQAVLYRNAVEAYCEVHGPLSTTLEWVIRHGSLSSRPGPASLTPTDPETEQTPDA